MSKPLKNADLLAAAELAPAPVGVSPGDEA